VGLLIGLQLLLLAMTSPAMGASPPTIAITSPSAGETVKGTVRIEATATAGAGEYPRYIAFYDGVNEIATEDCQDQQSCTASVEWSATGLSGQHSLTAKVETNEDIAATSTAVIVTVVSPAATVAIASPAAGATVEGTVTVVADAATDPSQDDYPTEIQVYDGVNEIGYTDCQGQRSCQGQVEWPATGLTGTHTLTAVVSTHRDLSVTSAPVNVTVVSPPPKVSITHPTGGAALRGIHAVTVSGATAKSQDDYPTEIIAYDGTSEIGSISCQGQQTCVGTVPWSTNGLKGTQKLTAVIHTNREREATSRPVYVGGDTGKPLAKVRCHIHSLYIRRGRYDRGGCVAYGVPGGTDVVVQYRVNGQGWTEGARGHISTAGDYAFKLRARHPATFQVSVLVSASSRYAATRVVLGTVHVA
jgi:Bacterial Ig domain